MSRLIDGHIARAILDRPFLLVSLVLAGFSALLTQSSFFASSDDDFQSLLFRVGTFTAIITLALALPVVFQCWWQRTGIMRWVGIVIYLLFTICILILYYQLFIPSGVVLKSVTNSRAFIFAVIVSVLFLLTGTASSADHKIYLLPAIVMIVFGVIAASYFLTSRYDYPLHVMASILSLSVIFASVIAVAYCQNFYHVFRVNELRNAGVLALSSLFSYFLFGALIAGVAINMPNYKDVLLVEQDAIVHAIKPVIAGIFVAPILGVAVLVTLPGFTFFIEGRKKSEATAISNPLIKMRDVWAMIRRFLPVPIAYGVQCAAVVFCLIYLVVYSVVPHMNELLFIVGIIILSALCFLSLRVTIMTTILLICGYILSLAVAGLFDLISNIPTQRINVIAASALVLPFLFLPYRDESENSPYTRSVVENVFAKSVGPYLLTSGFGVFVFLGLGLAGFWQGGVGMAAYFAILQTIILLLFAPLIMVLSARYGKL